MLKTWKRSSATVCVAWLCVALNGCNIVGPLAAIAIPQYEYAKYVGLQNQSIGVMVWADRGVRIDWDKIQLDIANAVQSSLQASNAKELQGATFPVLPASIVRFQYDHPHLESAPVTDFAAQLGVTRLIYIELERFSTRSDMSYQLYRGTAIATLKVIEIENGKATLAFEENGITAGFPIKGRPEGEVTGTDAAFYTGTIRSLAEQIVNRLITREVN